MNVASCACFEIICRQLQICEDKLAHKFEDNSSELSSDYHLMSGSKLRAQLCISPELRAWTASETAKESAVLKERRKPREERTLANPKRGARGGRPPNAPGGDG
jgi:hypothetical protein